MSNEQQARKDAKEAQRLKRLMEFHCAYCGQSKNDRPPEWCVRRHEGFDVRLREQPSLRDAR